MISGEAEARAWLRSLPEWDEVASLRLEQFVALLREENEHQNLVSSASVGRIWSRHIADSAQLLAHVPRGTSPWIDLGTGSGFPGVVIAALRPDMTVIMVESRKKRAEWLEQVTTQLKLPRAKVISSRLEDIASIPAGAISARAFAPLNRLLSLSARFSTADTIWVLPKGRSAQQELDTLCGWIHAFHVEPSLTDPEAGLIVGQLHGRKGNAP